MEEEIEMKVIQVNYKCMKCNNGYLIANGTVYTSFPAQYDHICNNCSYEHRFIGQSYPYTKYEEIN